MGSDPLSISLCFVVNSSTFAEGSYDDIARSSTYPEIYSYMLTTFLIQILSSALEGLNPMIGSHCIFPSNVSKDSLIHQWRKKPF